MLLPSSRVDMSPRSLPIVTEAISISPHADVIVLTFPLCEGGVSTVSRILLLTRSCMDYPVSEP